MPIVRTPTCAVCGKDDKVEMTDEQRDKLQQGSGFIQDIFPNWTPEKRELVITGTHPKCWDKLWKEGDD